MSLSTHFSLRRGSMLNSESLVKRGTLAAGLLIIALIVLATKFTSLDVNGADYAQLARNLATGHGYTTSVITPLSLALVPRIENHPEMTRPPAYVTVLALGMLIGGATDKTVAVISIIFLLLTALALYFIALRVFGPRVALWALLLYATSVPLLRQAISGLDTTFLSFLVTLLFGALIWNYRAARGEEDEEEEPSRLGLCVPIAVGVLVGLCYLTSYDTLVLLPVALYFLWRADRPQAKRNLIAVLVVFLILVLPWIIRCSVIAGGPFISLHSYELAMFTDQYPGQTLFRRFDDVPSKPWLMLIAHWPDMVKKIGQGIGGLYTDAAQFAGPYLMPFFIVGLLLAAPRRRSVLLHGCLGLAILLQLAVLCYYQPLARILLPYAPMVAMLAVFWFTTLVEEWNEALLGLRRHYQGLGLSLDAVLYAGLVVAMAIPLVLFLFLSGESRAHPAIDTMRQLGSMPYPYLATDLPWLAAWYGDKQALSLPYRERDWTAMEQAKLTPPAIYLSPALLEAPPTERMESWQRLLLSGQDFHGMKRIPNWRQAGVLLAKTAPPSPAVRGARGATGSGTPATGGRPPAAGSASGERAPAGGAPTGSAAPP